MIAQIFDEGLRDLRRIYEEQTGRKSEDSPADFIKWINETYGEKK